MYIKVLNTDTIPYQYNQSIHFAFILGVVILKVGGVTVHFKMVVYNLSHCPIKLF